MIQGLIGKKVGMTQIFDESGRAVGVTVIEAGPCFVTQVRTQERDGYEAVQLGFGESKRISKPEKGHLKNLRPLRHLREVKTTSTDDVETGQTVDVSIFEQGQTVDVQGTSKGKGFAGTVKRHGFRGGPKTHGQSDRLRAPGSIGATSTPGKVLKGKRMAGHMGNETVTVKGLSVARVDPARNLLLLEGSVPGANGGLVLIKKSAR